MNPRVGPVASLPELELVKLCALLVDRYTPVAPPEKTVAPFDINDCMFSPETPVACCHCASAELVNIVMLNVQLNAMR